MSDRSPMELLDGIAFGLARHAGLGPTPAVTIELERKSAEALLFRLSKDIENLMVDFCRSHVIIGLGTVFQYRGVNFRIVERAKYD